MRYQNIVVDSGLPESAIVVCCLRGVRRHAQHAEPGEATEVTAGQAQFIER